jgi:hypothetical protein
MTKQVEVDILAIQEEAERIAREEYMAAHHKLQERENVIRDRELKWGQVLSMLNMSPLVTNNGVIVGETDPDQVLAAVHTAVTEYTKLNKMFKMINDNQLLKSQWDRLVMSMRLAGGDAK